MEEGRVEVIFEVRARTSGPCGSSSGNSFIYPTDSNRHYHHPSSPHQTTPEMFRTAVLRSARSLAQASTRAYQPAVRRAVVTPFVTSRISTPAFFISAVRGYASGSGLGQEEVTGRIMDLLKNFDKVWTDDEWAMGVYTDDVDCAGQRSI